MKTSFPSFKTTLLTRLIKSRYQKNFIWIKTLHFTQCLCYLNFDRHNPNHDKFIFFLWLWDGTIKFSNLDGFSIFNWIQAIFLINLLGKINCVFFVINIKSHFPLVAINNSPYSVKMTSSSSSDICFITLSWCLT